MPDNIKHPVVHDGSLYIYLFNFTYTYENGSQSVGYGRISTYDSIVTGRGMDALLADAHEHLDENKRDYIMFNVNMIICVHIVDKDGNIT